MPGQDLLRAAENRALDKNPEGSLYSGTGKSSNAKNPKGKFSLKKRKGLAGILIALGLIGGGGILMSSSHLTLGPAMSSILTGSSDFGYTATYSQYAKNNGFMHSVMKKLSSVKSKPTDFSDDFTTNLKTFGIDVIDNGHEITFDYGGITVTGENFTEVFNNNREFRTAFTNAKQGRAANFFDNKAMTNYNHLNVTRNNLKDYHDTGDIETDTNNYNSTLSKNFDNQSVDITTTREEDKEREVTGEDGKTTTEKYPENERNDTASSSSANTDIDVATTRASEFISKVGTVTNVLNWGCTVMRTGNMVIKTASAMERLASIMYFMGIMESISKMMAGDGDASGYNVLMNNLVTPVTTTISDYAHASASASWNQTTDRSSKETGTLEVNIGDKEVTGAPIDSNLSKVLAYQPLNQELAKNFSFDSMSTLFTSAFTGVLGFTTMKAAGCAVTNIGESVASVAINLLPGGQGIKIVGGMIFKGIFLGIASFSLGSVLGFLIPQIARSLFMNKYDNLAGIASGEETVRGAFTANGKLAQSAGNGFGSPEEAESFGRVTNQVLAMEAESDRLNRSPFDLTSKNTFLGSIAHSLLATTISSKNYSTFTSLVNTTAKSVASLTNSVYADASTASQTDVMDHNGECEFSSMGIAGTVWCTTLPVVSNTALTTDPTDPDYVNTINAELDDDGEIKKDSDLARAISFCMERDSAPSETPDARILDELRSTPSILSALGNFPLIGDAINVIEGVDDLAIINDPLIYGWATGETCQTHPNMNKYKTYLIQERLYEQTMADQATGLAYISPVTRYIEEYDAEHPINNMTDLIAHYAGITTEDADLVLALVDYYEFLEDYKPETRIAMDGTASEQLSGETIVANITSEHLHFTDETHKSEEPVTLISQHIIYADVRNRSYAA